MIEELQAGRQGGGLVMQSSRPFLTVQSHHQLRCRVLSVLAGANNCNGIVADWCKRKAMT
jgi:hypothetical protein